jgi:molybdopterin/thiamine biosynthesis adenylyltransferase
MSLTDEELDRYARHIVLRDVGGPGQMKIRAANMLVIGAGGIGSPAIQYLAAAGVGALTIVDDDVVSLSNLQRQVLFTTEDIGQSKAKLAAKRVRAINPNVAVTAVVHRITSENAADLLRNMDVVLDGSDNFKTRLAVADAANAARVPLVSAAIGQFHGQLGTFRGWEADKPCYRCFVGDAHDAEDCDNCADLGVLGAMVGMLGSMAAMEALRVVTGFGSDQAGKLQVIDGLDLTMRAIRLPKDPGCSTCGGPSG